MIDIIFSGILLLFGLVCFVLTGVMKFGFMVMVCGLWLGWSLNRCRRKVKGDPKNLVGRIFIASIVTALGLSMPAMEISSSSAWRLPFQKAYMNLYRNTNYPDYFPTPEEVKQVHGAYRMNYLASVMQGTGHITVSFTAEGDYVRRVGEQFSSQAATSFPLLAYTDENAYYNAYIMRDGKENAAKNTLANDYVSPVPGNTNLYLDPDFEKFLSDEAVVYMLSDNHDQNHPHSAAVIVDTKTNAVEFVKYG